MRNYQQLLEQALKRAGKLTPSVGSVGKLTGRFCEKQAGTGGVDTPSVGSVGKLTGRFCEKQAGTGGVDTPSVGSVSNLDKHFLKNNDDDYREMFEERAAIMECDGGLSRHAAQVQANIICLAWFRENHQKRRVT